VQGLRDPAAFILESELGFPSHNTSPQRKLSWWFNVSLAQFTLLKEAGISITELRPGVIQPARSNQAPPLALASARHSGPGAAWLTPRSSGDRRRAGGPGSRGRKASGADHDGWPRWLARTRGTPCARLSPRAGDVSAESSIGASA
jgi:hypothetical protein